MPFTALDWELELWMATVEDEIKKLLDASEEVAYMRIARSPPQYSLGLPAQAISEDPD